MTATNLEKASFDSLIREENPWVNPTQDDISLFRGKFKIESQFILLPEDITLEESNDNDADIFIYLYDRLLITNIDADVGDGNLLNQTSPHMFTETNLERFADWGETFAKSEIWFNYAESMINDQLIIDNKLPFLEQNKNLAQNLSDNLTQIENIPDNGKIGGTINGYIDHGIVSIPGYHTKYNSEWIEDLLGLELKLDNIANNFIAMEQAYQTLETIFATEFNNFKTVMRNDVKDFEWLIYNNFNNAIVFNGIFEIATNLTSTFIRGFPFIVDTDPTTSAFNFTTIDSTYDSMNNKTIIRVEESIDPLGAGPYKINGLYLVLGFSKPTPSTEREIILQNDVTNIFYSLEILSTPILTFDDKATGTAVLAAFQEINFSGLISDSSNPSGLLNDLTVYEFDLTIDGGIPTNLLFIGSSHQTIQDILDTINLTAGLSANLNSGNIRIVSDSISVSSSVSITNDQLFKEMDNFKIIFSTFFETPGDVSANFIIDDDFFIKNDFGLPKRIKIITSEFDISSNKTSIGFLPSNDLTEDETYLMFSVVLTYDGSDKFTILGDFTEKFTVNHKFYIENDSMVLIEVLVLFSKFNIGLNETTITINPITNVTNNKQYLVQQTLLEGNTFTGSNEKFETLDVAYNISLDESTLTVKTDADVDIISNDFLVFFNTQFMTLATLSLRKTYNELTVAQILFLLEFVIKPANDILQSGASGPMSDLDLLNTEFNKQIDRELWWWKDGIKSADYDYTKIADLNKIISYALRLKDNLNNLNYEAIINRHGDTPITDNMNE